MQHKLYKSTHARLNTTQLMDGPTCGMCRHRVFYVEMICRCLISHILMEACGPVSPTLCCFNCNAESMCSELLCCWMLTDQKCCMLVLPGKFFCDFDVCGISQTVWTVACVYSFNIMFIPKTTQNTTTTNHINVDPTHTCFDVVCLFVVDIIVCLNTNICIY